MAAVVCVDGSKLGVSPVPVVDRDGAPYELTLRLSRDDQPFGAVGERCGWFLAATAARLRAAGADGSAESEVWPDRDDRFSASAIEGGLRAWAGDQGLEPDSTWAQLERYMPRDRDLFVFRHRDPDDLISEGEIRCSVHSTKTWVDGAGTARAGGRWQLARRAVLDAWGHGGEGLRAVLTAPQLVHFLDALLAEAAVLGCVYSTDEPQVVVRRPAG
ncbi:MAG TPA: hypothetical protein VNB94_01365 [Mycobacteriales bacterium]|nr:hypothetical protein [Mycobacteriales bacterium]